MDYLCGIFGIKQKDKMTRSDWIAIEQTGDPKVLRKMLKYNRGDVRSGAKLLSILRGNTPEDFGMTRFKKEPKDSRLEVRTQMDDIEDVVNEYNDNIQR